jgi:hypothetical protein
MRPARLPERGTALTTATLRLLATVTVGVAYIWAAVTFWGFYAATNPINAPLMDVLARNGHSAAYRVSISIHDVVVNVVLALPFAAVFRLSQGLRNWAYVAVAAATAVIGTLAAFTNWEALPMLVGSWGFWFGLGMTALSLPGAFALLSKIRFGATPSAAANDAA